MGVKGPFEGASVQPARVGARLALFRQVWVENIEDPWILQTTLHWPSLDLFEASRGHVLSNMFSKLFSKERSFHRLCTNVIGAVSSNTGSGRRKTQGGVLPVVSGQEKGRRTKASNKSKETEPNHSERSFQDGIPTINPAGRQVKRLDGYGELKRCLLSCTNPPRLSALPAFNLWGSIIPSSFVFPLV